MATFPSIIDSFTTHADGDVIYAADINVIQNAVVACETLLGTTGTLDDTTVTYKLANVSGGDQAVGAAQTVVLTNKTLGSGTTVLLGSDATGDIYYNGGSGTLTRLGIGSNAQVLTVVGGALAWATPTSVANASYSVLGVVQGLTDAATSGLVLSSGVISVNYGTGANQIVKLDGSSKLPAVDGSALTNLPSAVFHQKLQFFSATGAEYAVQNSTSETNGNVIYIASYGNTSNWVISRYTKDSTTGQYYCTHSITTIKVASNTPFSLAVLGSNLYLFTRVGGTAAITRFLSADLTGETNMTISGTSFASGLSAWSDGTSLYVYESSGVFRQYSVSGTTATNVTTITYTSSGISRGAISNGSKLWLIDDQNSPTIRQYPVAGGAAGSSLALNNWGSGGGGQVYVNQDYTHLTFNKASVLGLIIPHTENSPTAIVGTVDEIIPITAP